jgi:BMFP domain-containing protein YqiC
VTEFDRLRLQVRTLTKGNEALAARVATLEATLAARPAPRKRIAAPRPDDRDIVGREKLWATYLALEMQHGHGGTKLSKLSFAIKHRLSPDEFVRWFSATDRRGVPAGSKPDRSHRRALADAISELEARSKNQRASGTLNSHGNALPSQFSVAQPQ